MNALPAISTAVFSGGLRAPTAAIQARLAAAQTELATGRHADTGLTLGARTADATNLHSVRTRLDAYASANAHATTRLDATQAALGDVFATIQSLAKTTVAAIGGTAMPASLTAQGKDAVSSILSALNTEVSGERVFAGVNTDVRPFTDDGTTGAQTVANVFSATFGCAPGDTAAASITPSAMTAFLDGPFAQSFSATGWSTTWSAASDAPITSRTGPTQTAVTSVTSNESALRNAVGAATMLSQLGIASLSADTRAVVLNHASGLLGQVTSGVTDLQARVGVMRNNVQAASDANDRTARFVDTQIGSIESVDPAEVSTRIAALTTQLEAAYTLTGKLSQLSLVHYLP